MCVCHCSCADHHSRCLVLSMRYSWENGKEETRRFGWVFEQAGEGELMISEVWFASGAMEMRFVRAGAREGSLGRSKVTRCWTCPSSAELCEVSPGLVASACQAQLSLWQTGLSSSPRYHRVVWPQRRFSGRAARALGGQRDLALPLAFGVLGPPCSRCTLSFTVQLLVGHPNVWPNSTRNANSRTSPVKPFQLSFEFVASRWRDQEDFLPFVGFSVVFVLFCLFPTNSVIFAWVLVQTSKKHKRSSILFICLELLHSWMNFFFFFFLILAQAFLVTKILMLCGGVRI